jgi:UPF0755 protein
MSFYHSSMSRKFQRRALFATQREPSHWRRLFVVMALCIGLFYGTVFLWPVVPSSSPSQAQFPGPSTYKVKIAPQSSLGSIADQLSAQGLKTPAIIFQIAARSIFVGSKLKPGTYLLPEHASLGKVLLKIARGDRVRESIAIIPGMSIWQVRALVDKHPALIHQTQGMNAKQLLESLNLHYPGDEGLFFPDTYIFDPDDTDLSVYKRASQAMQKQLSAAWDQRESNSPLKSPYELLILASIVEKETGRHSDRSLVAAVFLNRLNLKMPLQTDPTIIYGIGPNFDGNLRKADLRKDSAYNTYMRKGLPPTPIAMPSKESLQASVHPAKTDAIYFVAKGDGTSHFSNNLKDHESAVDQYQRKRNSAQK